MSDLEQALEWAAQPASPRLTGDDVMDFMHESDRHLSVIIAAAREHVSCGQGETIWWCPVHRAPEAASEQAGVCWYYDGGEECRLVEAVLTVRKGDGQ